MESIKNIQVLSLYSNYIHVIYKMKDKMYIVEDNLLTFDETINYFSNLVKPFGLLRCEILDGIWDEILNNGKGDFKYKFNKIIDLSKSKQISYNNKITLKKLGYTGNFDLSKVIDWIRKEYNFNIWIEHGHNLTHDVTTKLGCHRGSFSSYEDAQLKGIEIFCNYLN